MFLRACLFPGEEGRSAGVTWLKQGQQSENTPKEEQVKSLLPLLFSTLRRNNVKVDNSFLTILRAASLREELRTKTYRHICREVFSALTAAGIPIIMLKGATLADTVYGDPALRHSRDIDLLLGEADPSRVLNLLSTVGFTLPKEKIMPKWQDIYLEHGSGLPLALHRHFFHIPLYNGCTADLWARSQMQVIADVPVRTLSPADALLHICGHASYSPSRVSLRWVCDAWLLIDQHPNLDWNVLFDCAVRSHLALPLSVMLGYLAEELQAPIPTIFLSRLQAAATQADTLEREAALSGARSGARGGFKNLLRRTSDWRMRAFVLRWMLFPSPEYLRSVQQIQPSRFLPFFYVDRCLKFLISRRS